MPKKLRQEEHRQGFRVSIDSGAHASGAPVRSRLETILRVQPVEVSDSSMKGLVGKSREPFLHDEVPKKFGLGILGLFLAWSFGGTPRKL